MPAGTARRRSTSRWSRRSARTARSCWSRRHRARATTCSPPRRRPSTLGAKVISNSWGGSEGFGEQDLDEPYFDQPGIAITFSTGDDGYGVQYPAASPFVTAVGGTSLSQAANSRGWSETAWSRRRQRLLRARGQAGLADRSLVLEAIGRRRLGRRRPVDRRGCLLGIARWLGEVRRHERRLADHRRGLWPGRSGHVGDLSQHLSVQPGRPAQ